MQTFVINIRPSQQETPNLVRVHRNNLDMAHRATGTIVLLYASREEIQHGYLGTAELVDVVAAPDAPHQIVLILDQIRMFDSPISPTFIFGSDQSDDAADPGGFHAYSRGVRPLTQVHYNRIIDAAEPPRFGDFSEKSSEAYSVSGPEGRERRAYEALVRSRRLRFGALGHYGPTCAVTRMKLGPAASLRHEVDICHPDKCEAKGSQAKVDALRLLVDPRKPPGAPGLHRRSRHSADPTAAGVSPARPCARSERGHLDITAANLGVARIGWVQGWRCFVLCLEWSAKAGLPLAAPAAR